MGSERLFYKLKNKSGKHKKYFDIYDSLFSKYKKKKITVVEIGVLNGGSLHLWRSIFGKTARIIGVDINPKTRILKKYGFEIFIGDQSDKNFWNNFFKKVGMVDIVIDDGAHKNEHQIITATSFIPKINDGGLLLVEDVNTSYMKEFLNPQKYSFINFCKKVIDDVNLSSPLLKNNFLFSYSKYVYSLEFFESIVVFKIDRKKNFTNFEVQNSGKNYNIEDLRDIKNKYAQLKDKVLFLKNYFVINRVILFFKFLIIFYKKKIINKKIRKYFT